MSKKIKQITKKVREDYICVLNSVGENGLFETTVGIGMKRSASIKNPEELILDESEGFLKLYRQTGDDRFLTISKILRKAAHVVYRQLLLQNPKKKFNIRRFLTRVA